MRYYYFFFYKIPNSRPSTRIYPRRWTSTLREFELPQGYIMYIVQCKKNGKKNPYTIIIIIIGIHSHGGQLVIWLISIDKYLYTVGRQYTMHIIICTKMHFTRLYYVNINLRHTRFDPTMTSVLKILNKCTC